MSRRYLVFAAVAVLAAIIALYVVLREDPGHGEIAVAPPAAPKNAEADPGRPRMTARPPERGGAVAPPAAAPATTEYTIDGIHVRDHRAGGQSPPDLPPAIHPPGGRRIPSQLTSEIMRNLRAVLATCGAGMPATDRGPASRIDGQIKIAIKDHQATVTRALVQLRGVTGGAVDSVKDCIERRSVGMVTPSGDEPDLDDYAITLSVGFP